MTQRKRITQDGFNRLTLAALVVMTVFTLMLSTAAAQEGVNNGAVSVGAGVDFTSHYYFRGIVQETDGFIAQPYLEAGLALGEHVSLTGGLWNSLHSGPTGSDGLATRRCGTKAISMRQLGLSLPKPVRQSAWPSLSRSGSA